MSETKPLSEWSDEELRVRVAELCGWKRLDFGWWHNSSGQTKPAPNYPADLNAMHEAVTSTVFQQRGFLSVYRNNLAKIVHPEEDIGLQSRAWLCVDATARQRAIAFISTLA